MGLSEMGGGGGGVENKLDKTFFSKKNWVFCSLEPPSMAQKHFVRPFGPKGSG